ncbi:MAG: hypothetical protein OQK12_19035 [Motiliproteus sp.]|nr:hypothetical protein [Motiliproteus sp.]MCW9052660.1 hypothetical protein [Motiliproteus sp.]
MSNSKWRKLFTAINVDSVPINQCSWKLVTEDKSLDGHLPNARYLSEDHVGDCGALSGPFLFQEIEWVLLPRVVSFQRYEHAPIEHLNQNIEALKTLIDETGNFEYEISIDGLKIYGYKNLV